MASRLQARRAAAAEGDDVCSLVVHDYDWHATGAPQRILGSLETSTHASVLLRLPRGRHVLQLTVDPGFYFHASARAASPFDMDEPAALLREKALAAPAVCEGAYGAINAGDFIVWFRRVFTVAEPKTLVSLCLEVGDPNMSPFARFAVVNNDAGEVSHFAPAPRRRARSSRTSADTRCWRTPRRSCLWRGARGASPRCPMRR